MVSTKHYIHIKPKLYKLELFGEQVVHQLPITKQLGCTFIYIKKPNSWVRFIIFEEEQGIKKR